MTGKQCRPSAAARGESKIFKIFKNKHKLCVAPCLYAGTVQQCGSVQRDQLATHEQGTQN